MAQLQTLNVPGDFVAQVKQDANHADLFLKGSLLVIVYCCKYLSIVAAELRSSQTAVPKHSGGSLPMFVVRCS